MDSKNIVYDDNRPFAHMFYFQLTDTSEEAIDVFINACVKCLGSHEGQIHFSVGTRALHIRRRVSALDYEVSVNMVFENEEAYNVYNKDSRHQDFINDVGTMSVSRVVYDSFIVHIDK